MQSVRLRVAPLQYPMSPSSLPSTSQYPELEAQSYDEQHALQTVSIYIPDPHQQERIKSGYWVMSAEHPPSITKASNPFHFFTYLPYKQAISTEAHGAIHTSLVPPSLLPRSYSSPV